MLGHTFPRQQTVSYCSNKAFTSLLSTRPRLRSTNQDESGHPPTMSLRAVRPIFRAQLSSRQANGHVAFIPQIRKLVFEYCEQWPSSSNTRTYVRNHLEELARNNPHVEIVVKQRNHKEPIIRGFYRTHHALSRVMLLLRHEHSVNNRDKVVPLNGFEVTGVAQKVQLLLDSSGAKIKPLKRRTVESTTEAARGIWSGMHVEEPFKI